MLRSNRTIEYPYAVLSDIHCHDWSAYSHINEWGTNNRLQYILDGILLAANTLENRGGKNIIITGDLFHTRGKIKPSVFNPVAILFEDLIGRGFIIDAIPGNHDLEGKYSDVVGNAFTTLALMGNFHVHNTPEVVGNHFFVPWLEDFSKVVEIANAKALRETNFTLLCHLGLSDVLPGYVGETVNPNDFSESYKYVFCGHFHNHVSFDSRVYSVGALTHQTWGDVGSKAGFLIVHEDSVEHYETNAPKFIDITESPPKAIRKGNYFRIKDCERTDDEVAEIKKKCFDYGALAVIDQSSKPTIVKKTYKHEIDVDLGLENAIAAYCVNNFGDKAKEVLKICLNSMS